VTVRGHLTAGSRGWALRAHATRRRSIINVHIIAVEIESSRHPDLEHHRYEATVQVTRPGSYAVRVTHDFLMRGGVGLSQPRPVYEKDLTVP